MPRALITGITGQDGSYLAEFLLDKGYEVYGIIRRASTERYARIEHLRNHLRLLQGDLPDQTSLLEALEESQPGATTHRRGSNTAPFLVAGNFPLPVECHAPRHPAQPTCPLSPDRRRPSLES